MWNGYSEMRARERERESAREKNVLFLLKLKLLFLDKTVQESEGP
jgi:hypothetical protein